MSTISQKSKRARDSLLNTIKLASELPDATLTSADLTRYSKICEKLILIEHNAEAHKEGLQAARTTHSLDEFDKNYIAVIQSKRMKAPRDTQTYKDFLEAAKLYYLTPEQIETNTVSVDGDLEIGEEIQRIDPLTKQQLQHPVRNRRCKHVYEKGAVEASIRQNPRLRCPAMGCGNKNFVTLADLEDDLVLARKLALLRVREKAAQFEDEESD